MTALYIIVVLGAVTAFVSLLLQLFWHPKRGSDDGLRELKGAFESFERFSREEMSRLRTELLAITSDNRRELADAMKNLSDSLLAQSATLRGEFSKANSDLKQQLNSDASQNREELKKALNDLSENLSRKLNELVATQQQQSDNLRKALETQMENIRQNNDAKLEQMRQTVDEKLHATLEKRLGESFQLVTERLELVHKSMGEMQNLAKGVGNLEKVLSNVKNRGVLGEMQLGHLLEDLLSANQYEVNFKPNKRRNEIVEFAIRLPGPDEEQENVFLPLDAKFPIEDYQRLLDAYEAGNPVKIEAERKNLADRIKACARDIRDKYLNPPLTTDFGLLFLPFEGLYAEALRITGLFETVMRESRVVICGPTTTAALINSLQIGFKTLAIQKKTAEVWKILSAIKHEFGKFGEILDTTQKKLQEASNTIEKASFRSRQIEKKLSKVQELPVAEATAILDLEDQSGESEP
jgi:DNA recombination protein RmuC